MKKTFIISSLIIISLNHSCNIPKHSSSQSNNQEECIRENWLTIYRGKDELLFKSIPEEMDIYEEIKQLLLEGEIRLWETRKNNPDWMTSPLPSMIHDTVPYSIDSQYFNPYFDYMSEGDATIKDVNGKDSLFILPDGTQSYLYPLIKYEPVTFNKITEIRIKEILVYDSLKNSNYLKPSLIAFDVYTTTHNIMFWVKVDDLEDKIRINRNWVHYIVNKQYNGFVYKRNSCDDPDYSWKKVYH